jgi:hypothetical protein
VLAVNSLPIIAKKKILLEMNGALLGPQIHVHSLSKPKAIARKIVMLMDAHLFQTFQMEDVS